VSGSTSSTPDPNQIREMFARLRGAGGRSHTHQSVDDIVRDLHIGPLERFLLWLSKTDYYVLSLSTYHSRLTLAGLGMMVVFTSLLAFSSSLYALLTTLVSPDSAWRWPVALTLASIYAFGIMLIDREIVGAVSMKSLPFRVLFAIAIATAVSWPVKLKFFDGRIQLEINRMVDEKNAAKLERIEQLKRTGEPERQQQRQAIRNRIDSLDREIAVLDSEINREARQVECGPKCQGFRRQKDELMIRRQQAEAELAGLGRPEALPDGIRKEIEQLQKEIADEHAVSYDFLTKWEALDRIKNQPNSDYPVLANFLLAFFMLLEMVPLALKWSLGKTEYHYYLDARTHLNNQKIISLSNLFMQAMQRDPQVVLDLIPLEVTDIIAAHMEDEARGGPDPVDYRNLMASLRGRKDPTTPDAMASTNADPSGSVPPSAGDSTPAASGNAPPPTQARPADETVFEDQVPQH
jgi:hypothetical protein